MMSEPRLPVLHYRDPFLRPSETFIRTLVAHHERYAPEVVAHERVAPTGRDPVPVRLYPEPDDALDRLARRLWWATRLPQRRRVLDRAVRELRPAIVHAHFGEDAVVAAAAAARHGIPSVAAFYGYDATVLARSPLWRRRFRRLFRRAAAVLAEGPAMAARLEALGCPAGRVVLQPIPIDIGLFPFRSPRAAPDRPVLIQACRFVEKKGVDLTMKALGRVAPRVPGVELRLVGDGPERPALEALAGRLGLGERVRFLGALPHDQYAEALADADIFVQPSRTAANGDGEGGAPTTLLEAQAVGLPIVASRHADIPWVVDPDAALLAPEDDPEALGDLLLRVLTDPGEWPGRAEAGRRHVEARHTPRRAVLALESLYDAILDHAAAPRGR